MAIGIALLAAVASTFNLTCAGDVKTVSLLGERHESYSSLYRIDLDAKRWCEGECKSVHDIADVQPAAIVLEKKDIDTPRNREWTSNVIDRETGAHRVSASGGLGAAAVGMTWVGTCQKGDFTGFPKLETKF
jgi:hypothetical protein